MTRGAAKAVLLVQLNVAAIAFLIYGWFFEESYLSYPELPAKVLNPGKQVRAGDKVLIRLVRCNADDVPHIYSVARNLMADKDRTMLEPKERMIDPGCDFKVREMDIPADTLPASSARTYGFSQTVGTLKTHIVRWKSEEFEILPAASGASK